MTTTENRLITQHRQCQKIPQPVGVDMTQTLAEMKPLNGRVVRLNMREGFDVFIYDVQTPEPIQLTTASEPSVSVSVMLDAAGCGRVINDALPSMSVPYQPATTYVSVMHEPLIASKKIPEGSRFMGVDIRMSFDFIARQKSLPNIQKLTHLPSWNSQQDKRCWLGYAASTQDALNQTVFVLDEAFKATPCDLQLESKILEIVAATLSQLTSGEEKPALSGRDQQSILKAEALLSNNLAYGWSIQELSQRAGLNEKKLKKGFRYIYGQPVYHYLQKARMQKARALLLAGNRSVTDIAMAVGYANPSHFAFLFKREFGCTPTQARGLAIKTEINRS